MNALLVLVAVIIFTCVLLNNASFRIGMPVLLAFILLGILFGVNGLIPSNLNVTDRKTVGDICTVALIFIMFYGGFGTSWKSARPIALEAGLLASVGVLTTAALVGVFCHFLLKWGWVEALLLGSVVSSTDAASVFSIFRSRKLGLKDNTAPLIEMESGSNDPCSYMLTVIMLSIMQGDVSVGHTIWLFVVQLGFGALFGFAIARAAVEAMKRIHFATAGFDSLFLMAVAIISYALPALVGGNGYLSAYIVGIVLGNNKFCNKKDMVHFFDGITGLMQVLIFFMLGLLAHPANLGSCILPAIAIFLVLSLVARPLSVSALLLPFGKYGFRQMTLISFCGLRGAASIVFAIMATLGNDALQNDIFNIVFCIVLISIALQGSFLPWTAKKLDMIDPNADVMKTFSDFSEEVDLQFSEIKLDEDSHWLDQRVMDLKLPKDLLFCMIVHADGSRRVPNGRTVLHLGDTIIVCSKKFRKSSQQIMVVQHVISDYSKWDGHKVSELPPTRNQLILIQRGDRTIIPHGDTVMMSGDVLYINQTS